MFLNATLNSTLPLRDLVHCAPDQRWMLRAFSLYWSQTVMLLLANGTEAFHQAQWAFTLTSLTTSLNAQLKCHSRALCHIHYQTTCINPIAKVPFAPTTYFYGAMVIFALTLILACTTLVLAVKRKQQINN